MKAQSREERYRYPPPSLPPLVPELTPVCRYAKQMERAILEREKQARIDAEAQKAELTAKLKAYEDQNQDQIRKLMELEKQAKALEDEKEEKVRHTSDTSPATCATCATP